MKPFDRKSLTFRIVNAPLDARTIPERHLLLREVVRIPYDVQFVRPRELAERVSLQTPVALLENDGARVLGKNALEAFDRLEALEATAESLINAPLARPDRADLR